MHSFMASPRSFRCSIADSLKQSSIPDEKVNLFSGSKRHFHEKTLDNGAKRRYSIGIMNKDTFKSFFDWRWCWRGIRLDRAF